MLYLKLIGDYMVKVVVNRLDKNPKDLPKGIASTGIANSVSGTLRSNIRFYSKKRLGTGDVGTLNTDKSIKIKRPSGQDLVFFEFI